MEKYEKLLHKMINEMEENHLCFPFVISKDELNKYTEKLLKENTIKDDYDFLYVARNIIKTALEPYDSHTNISLIKSMGAILPINIKYIDNKFYIVKTNENHKDIEYSQLLKVNDIDVKELYKEAEKEISATTQEYKNNRISCTLLNTNDLRTLPSIKNDCDKIIYTIKDKDGKIKNYTFDANKQEERKNYLRKENYRYTIYNNTLIINYFSCSESKPNQMINFVKDIKDVAKNNDIKNYIVDLRGNTGGNSDIINPLISYLDGKDIVTLVDDRVFSSGRFAIMSLKEIGSKTVGTGIGTSINAFGNIQKEMTSIDDNIGIYYSTKYFCFNPTFICYQDQKEFAKHKNDKAILERDIFEPDIYVENSIDDYKNGVDKQLEVALKELNKTKEK